MTKINSLNEAIDRLDALMKQAGADDQALKTYLISLHTEKQNLVQKLNKLRQKTAKSDTTSSMHSKLKDALYE